MEMVKVDPKLFITCRLCLEELGMYQITPAVQQQIKYCFDIDIDQYDGLPQLICKQCEEILSDYSTKKRIFVGRQNALKAKIEVRKEVEGSICPSPPHEAVSSSQQCDNEEKSLDDDDEKIRRKSISKSKKRKSRVISSSSSSSNHSKQEVAPEGEALENDDKSPDKIPNSKKRHENKRSKTRRDSWEEKYTKGHVCKLCNKYLKFGGGIGNHVRTHAALLSKYDDIINKSCKVQLVKIDGKPNPTGNDHTVALSQNKIIGLHKDYTYLVYSSKEGSQNAENTDYATSEVSVVDSDDEQEVLGKGLHAKRRRLFSRSSTDTVVLNDDDATSVVGSRRKLAVLKSPNHLDEEIECINIDDSSNGSQQSDSLSANDFDSSPVTPKDVETIKNLIKVCHNKYATKRQEMLEMDIKKAANKGPQLKHKLLSTGRKTINRQGLSCTGLLRFMENRNLAVTWVPMMSSNKEMNFVRITARLKNGNELASEFLGWRRRHERPEEKQLKILQKQDNYFSVIQKRRLEKKSAKSGSNSKSIVSSVSTPTHTPSVNKVVGNIEIITTSRENSLPLINSSLVSCNLSEVADESPTSSKTLLERDSLFQDSDAKLLNANPVANPKQLPKKFNNFEPKFNSTQAIIESVVQQNYSQSNTDTHDHESQRVDNNQQVDAEMCMPIITSTTSLAGSSTNNNPPDDSVQNEILLDKNTISNIENTNGIEKPAPRIKVKPFSELMSERALKTLSHTQAAPDNIWVANESTTTWPSGTMTVTRVTSSGNMPIDSTQVMPSADPKALPVAPPNTQQNYIILDTVELPNMKTTSPIQYFRTLLLVHNIKLLESHTSLPLSADCLIKFKLQFVRENVNQPVTLCLSVHSEDNMFYLGVRDPNQLDSSINLDQLSANWQWEILKIYTVRQDVVNKMLHNAQKISQKVFEYTKTFLSLLKSVNVKKSE